MRTDRHSVWVTWTRNLTVVVVSTALAGCATDEGGRGMRGKEMGAMQEHPMHQMMQEMGCAHEPSDMQAMKKMAPDEKHARMMAHMQECKAKMRQQAVDEAMARIDQCMAERMSVPHGKLMKKVKMHAQMMADIRACASQPQPAGAASSKPSTHERH